VTASGCEQRTASAVLTVNAPPPPSGCPAGKVDCCGDGVCRSTCRGVFCP
jgi:hypothetical protein